MSTFLFNEIIFGPIWSRRLGQSLGINLLPLNYKLCNFNCLYCECGITNSINQQLNLPEVNEIKNLLMLKLKEMGNNNEYLDTITFAGNGEPTLHPSFPLIIYETIECRNKFYPSAKIAVLSNATLIKNKQIFDALLKVDLNILKLDSGIEKTLKLINCPQGKFEFSEIINVLKEFKGKLIIQTLFFRGMFNNTIIDNTTDNEIDAWIQTLKIIKPESVMIYSINRDTPVEGLNKIDEVELKSIAQKAMDEGIQAYVYP